MIRSHLVLLTLAIVAGPVFADAEVTFATKVLPLLQSRCYACHGSDVKKIKGGLDLTSRKTLLKAVVPGKSGDSTLYKAVLRTDDDVAAMPPKESDKLTADEVAAIKVWIDGGAPWPSAERIAALVKSVKNGITVKTSGGLSVDWTNRKYKPEDLWAYQPLRKPTVPNSVTGSVIDAFLAAKFDGIPAELADRRTLIRRVTFDLLGLPPSPEEVDAFVNDTSPDAYERLIDRLMSSPHYGEQMAQRWLDVTRYADSSGLANDYERGSAWRYRDYVARSFAGDKPYDQFVREQIAGDEIDSANPEMLVAVGFLRMGAWELTGMEVAKVARQRFLDDVTDAVGQVFLAHMLQCARCHDHKFDPVPTRDYYRIQAAFATTQLAERPAAFLPTENLSGFGEKKYLAARRKLFEAELQRINKTEAAARAKWLADNPDKKGIKPPRHEFLTPADLGLERIARKGLERLLWEADRYEPFALSVYTGVTPEVRGIYSPFRIPTNRAKGTFEDTHVLAGGDPFSPKERVKAGVLSAAGEGTIPETTGGRRKALAEWIVDPENPLTARVMVNRIWQWTMGTPLAGNPNNFGATGKKPTHPELLDWLAAEFVENKWSVKQLQRRILLSEAYRRSSRSRRLTAEELRDAMLATSGELNRAIGGIPVRPEINTDVAAQPRQVMGTFAPTWEPSPAPQDRHRRTLYTLKLRGLRDPMLEGFNAPSPESSCEVREVSTIAPQAFTLLNSDNSRSRALAFADRLLKQTKDADEAIRLAFRLAFSRTPTERELAACKKHWVGMTERHKTLQFQKPKRATKITREAVEENTGEKFTFTEVLTSAEDFVADLHPADVSAEVRGLMEVCLVLFNANEFVYLD